MFENYFQMSKCYSVTIRHRNNFEHQHGIIHPRNYPVLICKDQYVGETMLFNCKLKFQSHVNIVTWWFL